MFGQIYYKSMPAPKEKAVAVNPDINSYEHQQDQEAKLFKEGLSKYYASAQSSNNNYSFKR